MPHLGSTQTERLRLERWSHDAHGDGFAAMNAQPEVLEYLGGGPGMTRAESTRRRPGSPRTGTRTASACGPRSSGRPVAMLGFVGLCHPLWWPAMVDRVEAGWRLRREAWGAG